MKTNIIPELSLLFRRLISRVELKLIPLHICNEGYLISMGASAAWTKGSGGGGSLLIWLSFVNVLPVAICIRIFNVYRSYFWPFRFRFRFLFRFHFRFHLMFMFSLVLHLINYRICSGFSYSGNVFMLLSLRSFRNVLWGRLGCELSYKFIAMVFSRYY